MTPTARTLKFCRENGWLAEVVERKIPHTHITVDFLGCIDILAVSNEIVGIQTTSGANHAARVKKAKAEPRLREWLNAGGRFLVISWRKAGKRGETKKWVHRDEWINFSDLEKA